MKPIVFLIPLTLLSCASTFRFEPNGQNELSPKGRSCDFIVVSTPPSSSEYLEIGTVNYVSGGVTSSTSEWKDVIRPEVCRAGGDLVVSEMNGYADLIRGIVFKRKTLQGSTNHKNGN